MSIFWGPKRSKAETLFVVSSLSTQTQYGTKEDYDDTITVLKYINDNKQ